MYGSMQNRMTVVYCVTSAGRYSARGSALRGGQPVVTDRREVY